MRASIQLTFRTLVVLALTLVMPLLAIPSVSQWVGSQWSKIAPKWLTLQADPSIARPAATAFRQEAVDANIPAIDPAVDQPSASQSATGPASQFKNVSARLKQLGAKNIRLETVGVNHDQYRFHCQLPVGDSVYARTFEYSSTDPDVAMEKVLADVQSWCVSRRSIDRGAESFR